MSHSAVWRIVVFCSAVFASWTSCADNSFAQSAALCVREHVLREAKEGKSLGIAASDALNLIEKVANTIALGIEITVIPCDFASKAIAWRASGQEGVPSGDYIIYNPTWTREVIGSDRVQAIALFGHELGHFLNGHFDRREKLSTQDKEMEADRFAGCAVARLDGDWASLENLLSRLRGERDTQYPSRLKSITAAKSGFENCGGKTQAAQPFEDIRILYFRKQSDRGLVENVLLKQRILFEVAAGENDVPTNALTCATDVPLDKVKHLALLLLDAGVELKSIHRHSNPSRKRLTVESQMLLRDVKALTRNEVMQLTECRPFQLPPRTPIALIFRSSCPDVAIRAYVRFKDAAKDAWSPVVAIPRIEFSEVITLSDSSGREYRTNERYIYVYAATTPSSEPEQSWSGRSWEQNHFDLPDGRRESFRRVTGNEMNFTCSNVDER